MKETILLGETLKGEKAELDLQELITGRTLLCSISRFGKSWTARRIVEEIFGKTLVVIIDVEGEYATLRDRFPFLIIGKDIPLVPESAEFMADQVLEHDLSVIIDGSDPQLDIAAFQEFLARFIDRFIAIETTARKPALWVLEEADELAPETGIARSICLGQIRKLVKKGGKRGIGTMILTQRPAFVSKFVISQCSNRMIGRTEWPDDLAILRKFARIPGKFADPESKDAHALKNLEKGQFFISGDFISTDQIVKVGPVSTRHLGSTPEIVPPAPKELAAMLAQLSEKLPAIIEEKLAPAVPKVAEIEARLKEKVEAQWQARVARKEKELSSIKARMEAKYETQIADLNRKLEEAARHATLAGGVTDLLSHPLVQKNVREKLNEKQWGFLELLETKGPQDPEHSSIYLNIGPKSVAGFVHEINRKVPKLVENISGRYASRLAKLFPVTEEAQTEAKEVDILRNQLARTITSKDAEIARLQRAYIEERDQHAKTRLKLEEAMLPAQGESSLGAAAQHPLEEKTDGNQGTTELVVKRTLTDVKVSVNHEILEVDESTWEGKICAIGLTGFFADGKGIGKIMGELVRRYNVSDSGGNRTTVNDRLAMLVSKGILDRRSEQNQWMYFASDAFKERVKEAKGNS